MLSLRPLRLFDVTLRDGLQSLPKIFSLAEKKDLLHQIIRDHAPQALEVGSLVSPKVLPQMSDSLALYTYAQRKYASDGAAFYLLVPSTEKYISYARANGVKNIALITSVSETFQQKNIRQSLAQTKALLAKCTGDFDQVKLYISCITQCPLVGPQDLTHIVREIQGYTEMPGLTELCLSDTCGSLTAQDFQTILAGDLDPEKLSLHLHVNPSALSEVGKILTAAREKGIYRFDVNAVAEAGGCSVTMNPAAMFGNLTYAQLRAGLL